MAMTKMGGPMMAAMLSMSGNSQKSSLPSASNAKSAAPTRNDRRFQFLMFFILIVKFLNLFLKYKYDYLNNYYNVNYLLVLVKKL